MAFEVEMEIPPHKFVIHVADEDITEDQLSDLSRGLRQWVNGAAHFGIPFEVQHAAAMLSKVLQELDDREEATEEQSLPEHRFRDLI
mgnify:CR=1 FL=1